MTKNKKESEGFETALKTGKLQDGVQDTETLRTILENSDEVLDVCFNTNGNRLASASADATARIYNVMTGTRC